MMFEQEKKISEKINIKEKKREHLAQLRDEKIVEKGGLTTARFFQRLRTRVSSFFTGKKTDDTVVAVKEEEESTQESPRRQPIS